MQWRSSTKHLPLDTISTGHAEVAWTRMGIPWPNTFLQLNGSRHLNRDGRLETTLFEKQPNVYLCTPRYSAHQKGMINEHIMDNIHQICSETSDISTQVNQFALHFPPCGYMPNHLHQLFKQAKANAQKYMTCSAQENDKLKLKHSVHSWWHLFSTWSSIHRIHPTTHELTHIKVTNPLSSMTSILDEPILVHKFIVA